MPILVYRVTRFRTGPVASVGLCETHVERRRVIGWRFLKTEKGATADRCSDCEIAKEPTVLDAVMRADPDLRRLDKQNETPEPVPVLKGQRSLF